MKGLIFTKMQASGNDFIVIEKNRLSSIIKMCDRIFGIGADGVLLLENSKKADVRMRIFNTDGSEAQMCGNGARCCALYVSRQSSAISHQKKVSIETKAGILEAEVRDKNIKLKMTDPADLKLGMSLRVAGREYEVDYLNTGVPHAVIEVGDIERICVKDLGRRIRHHRAFFPAGANVDFVKVERKDHILVRTYERGVEDETLACGTGSVACAIIATLNHSARALGKANASSAHKVYVKTRSRETLIAYFKISKYKITDVWLEGEAKIVYKGEYYPSLKHSKNL